MTSDWRQRNFAAVACLRREKASPEQIHPDEPYIGLEHIEPEALLLSSVGRGAEAASTKARFRQGDVLFGRLRPYFRKVVRPRFGGVCSTDIWVLQPRQGVDGGFLFYLVASPRFVDFVNSGSSGTRMPRANWKHACTLEVLLPPFDEQQAIAEVLGALDDRIQWCDRTARDLLELSRAAFHEWVASESVRDVSIYDLASVEYGAPYKSALFNEDKKGMPVIRIRDVGSEDTSAYTTERHQRDVVIEPGDIVVGMDGEFRAHPWRGPAGLLNQRVCTFRPQPGFARTLVLHALEEPLRFYENSITGTTVIHLGKKHIDRFRVPYSESGNEFLRAAADPMLDRVVDLAEEMRTLRGLRDTLLPKLVSGGLRIEDPSRLLGTVA